MELGPWFRAHWIGGVEAHVLCIEFILLQSVVFLVVG